MWINKNLNCWRKINTCKRPIKWLKQINKLWIFNVQNTLTENKSESGLLRFQILGKNQEPKIWKNLTIQFSSFPFDMTCFAVLCVKDILMNLPKHQRYFTKEFKTMYYIFVYFYRSLNNSLYPKSTIAK